MCRRRPLSSACSNSSIPTLQTRITTDLNTPALLEELRYTASPSGTPVGPVPSVIVEELGVRRSHPALRWLPALRFGIADTVPCTHVKFSDAAVLKDVDYDTAIERELENVLDSQKESRAARFGSSQQLVFAPVRIPKPVGPCSFLRVVEQPATSSRLSFEYEARVSAWSCSIAVAETAR